MLSRLGQFFFLLILLLATAVIAQSESKSNASSSEINRSALPLMWEPLDRPLNLKNNSNNQKLSAEPGKPDIEAVWLCPTQWLAGINFGGETFGGSISRGVLFFGSAIGDSEYVKVLIEFDSATSKQTLCQTYRRDLGYIPSGVGTFPGAAWDITDTLNPRRLNLLFVENSPQGNVNSKWDPNTSLDSREYLFIMNSDYDSSGTTYAGNNILNDASTLDILYNWWPILVPGHSLFESEPCTLTITPFYVKGFVTVPNGTETILEWQYAGFDAIDHFDIYCDTVSPPTTLLTQVAFPGNRFVHSPVIEGETYYYRIEADDAARSIVAVSNEVSILAQSPFNNTALIDFWNGRSLYGDCWGYVDTAGNEYALICARNEGVSIIDINTNPMTEVGFLPGPFIGSDAKDVKIYKDYAVVINEHASTQIFDISDVTAPFQVSTIAHDNGSGAHNCKVEGDYLYIMGDHNIGGLLIYDISTPAFPLFMSSIEPYYYHDIDIYNDTLYATAYGNGIDVLDISNKAAPSFITNFNYPGSGAHNAAVLDSGRYVAIGDEIGTGQHTRIFDVQNLGNVTKVADIIVDPSAATHNCYEKNDTLYVANYTEGLKIYNVSVPAMPVQIGHYDTYLESGFGYRGNWNVYPYLPSGKILLSDMQSGLFVIEFVSGSCCIGSRGDVNGDGDDHNVLDLTFLVDFIFRGSGDPGDCPEEADLNSDGEGPNILDLTFAVDRIFRGGPAAGSCP